MKPKITHEQTFYKIGLLKIKRKTKKDPLIKPSYQLRDLTDSNVYISINIIKKDDQKYQGELRQCFLKAESAQFRSLNLVRNMQSEILKEISHISFTSLRVLQLSGNYIDNIEPLGWMNMKGLRVLDLRENYIVQAKPLAKVYTRSLSELKIGLNLINSLQCLARMKFRVNQGNRDISLFYDTSLKPYTFPVNDLSFLAKLDDPKQLQQEWVSLYHKKRINIPKFYSAISRRTNKKRSIVVSYKAQ